MKHYGYKHNPKNDKYECSCCHPEKKPDMKKKKKVWVGWVEDGYPITQVFDREVGGCIDWGVFVFKKKFKNYKKIRITVEEV